MDKVSEPAIADPTQQPAPPAPSVKSSLWLKLVIVGGVAALVIAIFVGWQYRQYRQDGSSCGGDWSYGVKCPLGTYCRSLNMGPLAGGVCQPYLSPLFNLFSSNDV